MYIYICIHVDTGSHIRLYKLRISTGEALPFAKKVAHAAAFVLRGDSGDWFFGSRQSVAFHPATTLPSYPSASKWRSGLGLVYVGLRVLEIMEHAEHAPVFPISSCPLFLGWWCHSGRWDQWDPRRTEPRSKWQVNLRKCVDRSPSQVFFLPHLLGCSLNCFLKGNHRAKENWRIDRRRSKTLICSSRRHSMSTCRRGFAEHRAS